MSGRYTRAGTLIFYWIIIPSVKKAFTSGRMQSPKDETHISLAAVGVLGIGPILALSAPPRNAGRAGRPRPHGESVGRRRPFGRYPSCKNLTSYNLTTRIFRKAPQLRPQRVRRSAWLRSRGPSEAWHQVWQRHPRPRITSACRSSSIDCRLRDRTSSSDVASGIRPIQPTESMCTRPIVGAGSCSQAIVRVIAKRSHRFSLIGATDRVLDSST